MAFTTIKNVRRYYARPSDPMGSYAHLIGPEPAAPILDLSIMDIAYALTNNSLEKTPKASASPEDAMREFCQAQMVRLMAAGLHGDFLMQAEVICETDTGIPSHERWAAHWCQDHFTTIINIGKGHEISLEPNASAPA